MNNSIRKLSSIALLSTSLSASATPLFNLFELGIQPNAITQYDDIAQNNIDLSIKQETGTMAMYSVKQANNPYIGYMIEIYANQESYQAHLQSSQYQLFKEQSPQILTNHKKRIELIPRFLSDKPFQPTNTIRTNLVVIEIKPEHNQSFTTIVLPEVLPEMQKSIDKESGFLAMYAATEKNQSNRWYFFEIYANDEAYQKHRQTSYFQDYLKQTSHMIENKNSILITPSFLANKGSLNYLNIQP